jgi:phospho-N-acetylmuramoyl-pentapeptide-transferase
MGDTGSMALGGLIAMFFLITKTPLFAPFVAIIYVAESLSVIIQRVYYKRTQKRIFLMAPIHHHFEQMGMSETMIVVMFSVITFVGLVVSLLMYYV